VEKETKALIAKKIERAREDLRFAKSLQAEGGFRQAVSRAYYAIFAAATAALLTQDISRKKHSAVEAAFNQYLAYAGLVERELAITYRDAFNARMDADYSDLIQFNESRTAEVVANADEFVQHMEEFLRGQGALD
jgi:uncharacterized protein (UPF0332 family)